MDTVHFSFMSHGKRLSAIIKAIIVETPTFDNLNKEFVKMSIKIHVSSH